LPNRIAQTQRSGISSKKVSKSPSQKFKYQAVKNSFARRDSPCLRRCCCCCCCCLECRPDHATFGSSHAADAEVVDFVVAYMWDGNGSALGAVGALGNTAGTGVVEFLDNLPAIPAWLASFACVSLRVVASILIERDGVTDVVVTDQVSTPSTVVPSEEPCECLVADVASCGRLVWLPMCGSGSAGDFSQLIVNNLTGCTAKSSAHRLDVVGVVEEVSCKLGPMRRVCMHAEAALIAGRWGIWRTWATWDVSWAWTSQLLRRSQCCWCVERLSRLSELPRLVVV